MKVSAPPTGLKREFAARFSRRDLVEAALIALAFLLYFAVRGAVIDRPDVAYRHALDVVDVQRSLGFFWEDDLNGFAKDNHALAQAMNVVYFYLHFPLIIAFGVWLYFFRRPKYTLTRDAFLLSGVVALIIYWSYPVAPPRELPELAARFDPGAPPYVVGFLDTMKEYLGYAYDTQSTRWFVNPYAAMPSLHFGWDLLLGMGVIWAFWGEPRFFRIALAIGVAMPVLQVFSVTMTANHFLLDVAAGGVVAMIGLGLAVLAQRWLYPHLDRWVRKTPSPAVRRWLLAEEDEPERAEIVRR